jgi:pimeloyl-ACP methyl ester carboxylesterase
MGSHQRPFRIEVDNFPFVVIMAVVRLTQPGANRLPNGTVEHAEAVARFAASVRAFHPAGFRAMTWSSGEAVLREILPTVDVPTLLLYGDQDARAPLDVAHALHAAIAGSELVILPDVGHASPVEAPELFNRELRHFLRHSIS